MTIVAAGAGSGDRPLYEPSPVKRNRRSDAEILIIKSAILDIVYEDHPMTLRALFYRLVAAGLIGKAENEYKNTGRYLLQMRRDGALPYHMIADNTRWMRRRPSYNSLDDALQRTAHNYRRALWTEQGAYVEIWCEKDTLAGVLYGETDAYDVPLMVVRGFSSETYLYEAASTMEEAGKPVCLYVMTDLDPSGVSIAADIERKIRGFIPDTDVTVDRIAVTPEQVSAWQLPTRPTKKTDTRAKSFTGESVELDAIPPSTLRQLVRDAIETHIDPEVLERTRETEYLERMTLHDIRAGLAGGA